MEKLQFKINPEVEIIFSNYPSEVKQKLLLLRELIIECAQDIEDLTHLEETLKWGEPSYLAKKGSTIRIDWKDKTPDQYAIYFKCTSKLVATFKELFGNLFNYEGNRAIIFKMEDELPKPALKKCISAALLYHKIKHLENLGITV